MDCTSQALHAVLNHKYRKSLTQTSQKFSLSPPIHHKTVNKQPECGWGRKYFFLNIKKIILGLAKLLNWDSEGMMKTPSCATDSGWSKVCHFIYKSLYLNKDNTSLPQVGVVRINWLKITTLLNTGNQTVQWNEMNWCKILTAWVHKTAWK